MDNKKLKESFDAAEIEFKEEPMDENYRNWLVGILSRGRVNLVLKEAKLSKNDIVLDAGCEAGYVSLLIAKKNVRVRSIDICFEALLKYKKKLKMIKQINKSPNIIKGMLQKLPFKDSMFDKIICTEVIEHVPFVESAFEEFKRVLKPGGLLILTFPNEHLRKLLYPLAKIAGINTSVEEQVTLFSYSFKKIIKKIDSLIPVKKSYSWPFILPVTRFVICKKQINSN